MVPLDVISMLKNKKLIACTTICLIAFSFFLSAGCVNQSYYVEEKDLSVTIKDIDYNPPSLGHRATFEITFDDGTWWVVQEQNDLAEYEYGVLFVATPKVCLSCFKKNHSYKIHLGKAENELWYLISVEDA